MMDLMRGRTAVRAKLDLGLQPGQMPEERPPFQHDLSSPQLPKDAMSITPSMLASLREQFVRLIKREEAPNVYRKRYADQNFTCLIVCLEVAVFATQKGVPDSTRRNRPHNPTEIIVLVSFSSPAELCLRPVALILSKDLEGKNRVFHLMSLDRKMKTWSRLPECEQGEFSDEQTISYRKSSDPHSDATVIHCDVVLS